MSSVPQASNSTSTEQLPEAWKIASLLLLMAVPPMLCFLVAD